MKSLLAWLVVLAAGVGLAAAADPDMTFYGGISGILQERCQSCHRPGEIGPMPLRTYSEVRPWAKAIRKAVVNRVMPPWYADPSVGTFHNDPSLPQSDIDKVVAWVDGGAVEGDPKQMPAARAFVDGWNIGNPAAVFDVPRAYQVPESGTVEYTYAIVPTGFTEDRWATGIEFRPGNRAVMHHATVFVREPKSTWLRKYPVGQYFVPEEQIRTAATPTPAATTNAGAGALDQAIAGYVPGRPERRLPAGYGMLIPAGSDLVFQLHYTTNGKGAEDRSRVGFVFAESPLQKRVIRVSAADDRFAIPPEAPDYAVSGAATLGVDSELLAVYPHMHLRGKSMMLSVLYPTGERDDLLRVPRYDFNWQLVYDLSEPKRLPKGTRLQADGTFDNSSNNRHNPNPKTEVRWGDQSWEEMMVGFFMLAVPADTDVRTVLARR